MFKLTPIILGIILTGCTSQLTNSSQSTTSAPVSQPQTKMIDTKSTALSELNLDESDYCYNTKMGKLYYNGVVNKSCVCDGELIKTYRFGDDEGNIIIYTKCPSNLSCDSSTVYCKGAITGYKAE